MTRNLTALLLAGALLCSLCACGPGRQPGGEVSSGNLPGSVSALPEPVPDHSEEEELPLEEQEPKTPPHTLAWEEDHKLETDFRPENHGGLELPVRGATGYTSVELGLWEIRPDLIPKPEPKAEPEREAEPEVATDGHGDSSDAQTETEPDHAADPDGQAGEGTGEAAPTEDDSSQEETSGTGEEAEQEGAASGETGAEHPTEPDPTAQSGEEEQPDPVQPEPEPDPFAGAMAVLEPGTPFTILEEQKDWWRVRCQQGTGWVEHRYCMINLPDVIPSMVYHATNSFSSLYRTSGKTIPGITGAAFYSGKSDNERLGREEYKMPVLYSMALKIAQAQRAALEEGNTLVLYEGYRPYSTQKAVRDAVGRMAEQDPEVKAG